VRGLPRRRPPALLLIATLITILLWLFFAGTARDPLFGTANARLAVEAAAVIATSCLFVTGAGGLILRLAASGETGAAATGLQRVLIYALLSFVAAFAALRYFDFDLGAMLTTSAIVSAAIGFAMQSTLGSMIAGIALNIDRMPRVGDGILLDGQLIRIESLSWRRVGGRRENGGLVIIPNARLADNTLEILPHDAPVRAEIFFQAPFAVPPQRICHLVVELVSDLAHVDAAEPIVVSPVDYDAGHSSLRYRIHCRVRRYHDLAALEGEVLRRLWYVFQRQRLWAPTDAGEAAGGAAWHTPGELARLIRELALPWLPADAGEAALALSSRSEPLLYAPGERITLPGWADGCKFLLLQGELVAASDVDAVLRGADSLPGIATQGSVPSVALHRARAELARHIGPYAEHAVRRGARSGRPLDDVFRDLALEIPDDLARSRFLDRVLPERPPGFRPGILLETYRNAAGSLVCNRPLLARGEVTILAMPS